MESGTSDLTIPSSSSPMTFNKNMVHIVNHVRKRDCDRIPTDPPLREICQARAEFVPLQQIPIRLNVASQHPPYPPRLHDLLDLQHDLGNAPLEPDDRASPALRSQRSKFLGAAQMLSQRPLDVDRLARSNGGRYEG
ncbi:hypothetical protein COL922a_008874 [Colletotrichum nupharicola]|nr:hypothetical protein COL922a_008874 [Colletotrichum nupharicola]